MMMTAQELVVPLENRIGERVHARVDVVMFQNGLPIFSGRSLNIGANGLYLQMPNTWLNVDDRVELDVCFYDDGHGKHDRLSATVVHIQNAGIGFMFDSANERVLERAHQSMPTFEVLTLQNQGRMLLNSA